MDMPGTMGWPDLIVARDGQYAFIECKADTLLIRNSQKTFAAVASLKYDIHCIYIASLYKGQFWIRNALEAEWMIFPELSDLVDVIIVESLA